MLQESKLIEIIVCNSGHGLIPITCILIKKMPHDEYITFIGMLLAKSSEIGSMCRTQFFEFNHHHVIYKQSAARGTKHTQ